VNEAEPVESGNQVVIATIAKLQGCVGDDGYDWLSNASCVVVDEAHGSTTTSYTAVLHWLGLGREQERDRCPLIGLTATPFRGTSVEETSRLVGRYGRNRLDREVLGDDPYARLQDMGVLARVRHQLLPGSDIRLTDEELARLRQTRLLPASAEASLTGNVERNRVLLESMSGLPGEWTVLVYAASVDHAELLASFLTLGGIEAVAISSRTPSGSRRYFIEEFRAGRIRVLTNYAVLTEGFDAPAVRAVYVARPTFSPNLYQQMIGRGLRGPLNGGKPECLVVNVADNVLQFGEELAFRQFEYLWDGDDS
jgi:superfamily II DNA or RNA helicase